MPPSLSFSICKRPNDSTSSHRGWEEQRAGTWGPTRSELQAAARASLKASQPTAAGLQVCGLPLPTAAALSTCCSPKPNEPPSSSCPTSPCSLHHNCPSQFHTAPPHTLTHLVVEDQPQVPRGRAIKQHGAQAAERPLLPDTHRRAQPRGQGRLRGFARCCWKSGLCLGAYRVFL